MKLNLGSGSKILDGYVNVDKFDLYNIDINYKKKFCPPQSD